MRRPPRLADLSVPVFSLSARAASRATRLSGGFLLGLAVLVAAIATEVALRPSALFFSMLSGSTPTTNAGGPAST